MPIEAEHLDDEAVVEYIGQLIFCFMKIQRGIGLRLIPLQVCKIWLDGTG